MRSCALIFSVLLVQSPVHAAYLDTAAQAPVVSPTLGAVERAKPVTPTEARMSVQILPADKAVVLHNPGKDSIQLLSVENSPDAQVTITSVTMEPGAVSDRHSHPNSEQVWIVQKGSGTLLLDHGTAQVIKAGDVVRTPPKTIHGVKNTGSGNFEYISITTPPEDMTHFYGEKIQKK